MPSAAPAQQFLDWSVESSADRCIAITRILLRDSGTPLLSLSLSLRADGGALMLAEVPVGASLRDGIVWLPAPGRPGRALEWQNCTPDACIATDNLTAADLNTLRPRRAISVAFRPLPASPPLVTPVSLMGLTRALAAVESCRAEVEN